MYEYEATVIDVIDGDTVDMQVRLGFDVMLKMRVRLAGLNAPETHGKVSDAEMLAGTNAKKYVETMISGKKIKIKTQKDKQEKYGRYLGDVYFLNEKNEEVWLNNELISKGYAKPYHGEKKEPFKEEVSNPIN